MSQQICYIITPIEVKVPIDIVHFKEKNCTVIPLLIDDNDFEKLVFSSSDSSTISEFMESAIIHLIYEYPTRKAFEFITNAKIETFGKFRQLWIAYFPSFDASCCTGFEVKASPIIKIGRLDNCFVFRLIGSVFRSVNFVSIFSNCRVSKLLRRPVALSM